VTVVVIAVEVDVRPDATPTVALHKASVVPVSSHRSSNDTVTPRLDVTVATWYVAGPDTTVMC